MGTKLAKYNETILGHTFLNNVKTNTPDFNIRYARGYQAGDIIPAGKYTVEDLAEILKYEFGDGVIGMQANHWMLHLVDTGPTDNPEAWTLPGEGSSQYDFYVNRVPGSISIDGTEHGNLVIISLFSGDPVTMLAQPHEDYKFLRWDVYDSWPDKSATYDKPEVSRLMPYALRNSPVYIAECEWLKMPVSATTNIKTPALNPKPICTFNVYEHGTDNLITTFEETYLSDLATGKIERNKLLDIEPVLKPGYNDGTYVFEKWEDGSTEMRRAISISDLAYSTQSKFLTAYFKDAAVIINLGKLPDNSLGYSGGWISSVDPISWSDDRDFTLRIPKPESGKFSAKVVKNEYAESGKEIVMTGIWVNDVLYPVDSEGLEAYAEFDVEEGGYYEVQLRTSIVPKPYEVTIFGDSYYTTDPAPGTYDVYITLEQPTFKVTCTPRSGYYVEEGILRAWNDATKQWEEYYSWHSDFIEIDFHLHTIKYQIEFRTRQIQQGTI